MSVAVEYRTPPAHLTTAAIIAELMWLGDAVAWRGRIGDHARLRVAALRRDVQRREWGASWIV